MKRLLVVGAAVLCLAAKYEVKTKTDEFTHTTKVYTSGNQLGCGKAFEAKLSLNFQRFTEDGGETSFQMFVMYEWTDWMFLSSDAPLMFLVDGETISIPADPDPRRTTISGHYVIESAMYEVDPELLGRLSAAKNVKVRVHGDKWSLDRCFGPENFQRIKDFVAQYAPAPPGPTPPTDAAAAPPAR